MVGIRRETCTFDYKKKTIKNKFVKKNIDKYVTNAHGVQMKGILIRENVNGKSGGISSPV